MIKVLFFASLREQFGDGVEISFKPELNVLDAWNLSTQYATLDSHVLMSINQEYTQQTQVLNENDEVAFFPPVTGG